MRSVEAPQVRGDKTITQENINSFSFVSAQDEGVKLGGLLNALPVGSAGLVFSSLLRNSTHPDTALGANLLGAVAGGCLEYLSMVTGLRALTLLALALYLGVGLLLLRSASRPAAS